MKSKHSFSQLPRHALIGALACLCYSLTSMMMTLVNKAIFSIFDFNYPLSMLLYQNIFTVALLQTAKYFGYLSFRGLEIETVKQWYPVNILFIIMLSSGSYALQLLSIPMVTIFKNITTAIVTFGDNILFKEQMTQGILASLIIMIFSSVVAGFNDLAFDGAGYSFMLINCLVSAAYVLYIRYAIKKTQLNEWGMVYYNNTLSITLLLPLVFINGEWPRIFEEVSSWSSQLWFMWFLIGVSGFCISICSFWAVKATSPTTYSIVGTLNKIPLTILGFVFFHSPMTQLGTASIFIGLIGGVLYSYEKQNLIRKKTLPLSSTQKI